MKNRTHLCPDTDAEIIWTDYNRESFDKGWSHSCFGVPPPDTAGLKFTVREAQHNNDSCFCQFTPLKGIIRFFFCLEDYWHMLLGSIAVMDKLYPLAKCDFCGEIAKRHIEGILSKHGKKSCYNCRGEHK